MVFDPNPLFYEMVGIFFNNRNKSDKVTICNEGSSRSSKTWDFYHMLVMYCENNKDANNEIYILRETLTNCKDFTFKEFQKCLKKIGIWDDENYKNPQKPYYNLYGNDVFFRGLDDSSEGYPSDIVFINEALENQNKEKVDGIAMRCRKLLVYDWNPKYTQHWCFDLEGQPNVHFTHSTYKNNKHLEQSVVNTIEGYCPWLLEDLHIQDEKKRRPNLINIKNGTADKYRWQVYGEGIRSSPEGLIFQYVTWVDEFPNIGFSYGLDFGFTTDPTAFVKYAEDEFNIWIELLLYEPTENADLIHEFAIANNIDIKIPTTADSSDKYTGENKGTVEMVRELYSKGWSISKVNKTKSVMYWLTSMKKKKVHIVKNHLYLQAKKEQENYKMKLINNIAINQPIDKFNHMWDSARYAHISYNKPMSAPPIIYS